MAITLNCPKCSKPFRVRDDVIGMRVKCPNCAAILQVPAALSPASLLISDVPPEPMGDSPPSLLNPGQRPMVPGHRPNLGHTAAAEEDVRSTFNSHTGPHDGGAAARPQTMPQMGHAPVSAQAQPQRPMIPAGTGFKTPSHSGQNYIGDNSPAASKGWSGVRAGLGWVRMGLFLLLLPALAEIARLYLIENKPEMFADKPGFLHLGNFNFWDDIRFLCIAVPAGLGFLSILLGRLICVSSAPGTSRTSGLAFAALACTFLGVGGAVLCGYAFLSPKIGKPLPDFEKFQWLGAGLALVFGVTAEVWFALFQGQVGFVLGYPTIQKQVGIAAMLVALTAFGILAADAFYPFLNAEAREKAALQADLKKMVDEAIADETEGMEPAPQPAAPAPVTNKEKAAVYKEKMVAKAKEIKEKGKEFAVDRRNWPYFAVYLFVLIVVLAAHGIAGSTKAVIRKWTALHPAV